MTGGVKKLISGADKLHDGTGEFRGKTSGMDTEIRSGIDSAIDAMSGGNSKTVSFVSAQNKSVTSVQFIIRTEAIKVKDVKEKPAVKKESTTFWQKLLDLVRK
jgi:putative membrane protein